MIPTKPRRIKLLKLSKNLERQYKLAKCRDCSVVVTQMDFAKILGKFTKVKIQFETNTPRSKRNAPPTPASKIKSNENGALPAHRRAYNPHPARALLGSGKKKKDDEKSPPRLPNILRESNRIRKTDVSDIVQSKISKNNDTKVKYYHIEFSSPVNVKTELKNEINLDSILSDINPKILPSEEWCIDYFPKKGEPKDDKIYDRIAAELEDLMYNEKTKSETNKEGKGDEFPSILDILNDTSKETPEKYVQSTANVESNDVEAMLLGKSNSATPMDVDEPKVSGVTADKNTECALEDNPKSPSILDEPQKEVPVLSLADKPLVISPKKTNLTAESKQIDVNDNTKTKNKNNIGSDVTQVIFKKTKNGTSAKTVICPKNMKYSISIDGKSIELLGAPKVICSLEDLQVLLQIVEESDLDSKYLEQ